MSHTNKHSRIEPTFESNTVGVTRSEYLETHTYEQAVEVVTGTSAGDDHSNDSSDAIVIKPYKWYHLVGWSVLTANILCVFVVLSSYTSITGRALTPMGLFAELVLWSILGLIISPVVISVYKTLVKDANN